MSNAKGESPDYLNSASAEAVCEVCWKEQLRGTEPLWQT